MLLIKNTSRKSELMAKIQDIQLMYCCDMCSEIFEGKDASLSAPIPNFEVALSTMPIMFVDKEGIIRGSSSMPSEEGDMLMGCPFCNHVHLFGFTDVW